MPVEKLEGLHFKTNPEGKSPSMEVRIDSLHCRLRRIGDHRFISLGSDALAIKEDLLFLDRLHSSLYRTGNSPNLAEFYAVFKEIFGESSLCYDDYKGAFGFPFEVEVFKGNAVYVYVLHVINRRGTVDFRFLKVPTSQEERLRRNIYHAPFEEFTGEEINLLILYLHNYVIGGIRILRKFYDEEFVKWNLSELIMFGFRQGTFFQHRYSDRAEFDAALKHTTPQAENDAAVQPEGTARMPVGHIHPLEQVDRK